MANTVAPFGFQFIGLLNGSPPNFAPQSMLIANNYNQAIGQNDPVTLNTNGYVTREASAALNMAGVFVGCRWLSVAFGRTIWRNYWPGTADAVGDIEAFVISHPDALFKVQMDGAVATRAMVGGNFDFTLGTPNSLSGISGASLTSGSIVTTATKPFRLYDLWSRYASPGENGTDDASANNTVIVLANNFANKTLTGTA
jgi:hypothetical protein